MANQAELYKSLRRNPDNQFFIDLMTLLEFRLDVVKGLLVQANNIGEIQRLQGRALELNDTISALTRKPVAKQHTGSFN